jgi:hypothetical protein
MRSPTDEGIPLTLIIQRLMDADLVPPEDGLALLAEIDTWSQPADGEDSPESGSIRRPSLVALEALAQTDWSDASAVRAALDRARALVKQSSASLAAPAAETGDTGESRE